MNIDPLRDPQGISPLEREAHVWSASIDDVQGLGAGATFESWLSNDELQRGRGIRQPEAAELFRCARGALRFALSHYADVAPAEWRFRTAAGGRPELSPPFDRLGLRFSVSHTPGLVACLVTAGLDAGLDVEGLGRIADPSRMMPLVCSDAEIAELRACADAAKNVRFHELWTLKEAYVKARGLGLTLPLNRITFSQSDGAIVGGFDAPIDDHPAEWQFALWQPTPHHQGAMAIRLGNCPNRRLVFRSALPSPARAPRA